MELLIDVSWDSLNSDSCDRISVTQELISPKLNISYI